MSDRTVRLSSAMICCPFKFGLERPAHMTVLPLWRKVDLAGIGVEKDFRRDVRALIENNIKDLVRRPIQARIVRNDCLGKHRDIPVQILKLDSEVEQQFRQIILTTVDGIAQLMDIHDMQATIRSQLVPRFVANAWLPHISNVNLPVNTLLTLPGVEYWDRDTVFI